MKHQNFNINGTRFFSQLFSSNSLTLYFDFGSLYTRVATSKKILINQPTCYLSEKNTGAILTMGKEALRSFGKSNSSTQVVFPIKKGSIYDSKEFDQYLELLLAQVKKILSWKLLTKVKAICYVPESATSLDKQLFINAFLNLGINQIHIENKASIILKNCSGTPTQSSHLNINKYNNDVITHNTIAVLDMGDQLSELAIGSFEDIMLATTLDFGGQQITQAIIDYLKEHCELQVSKTQAMSIKHQMPNIVERETRRVSNVEAGRVDKKNSSLSKTLINNSVINVRGVGLSEGLVITEKIQVESIKNIILNQLKQLSKKIKSSLLNSNSQELVSALENGLIITGGGSLLAGIDDFLSEEVGLVVYKSSNPYSFLEKRPE